MDREVARWVRVGTWVERWPDGSRDGGWVERWWPAPADETTLPDEPPSGDVGVGNVDPMSDGAIPSVEDVNAMLETAFPGTDSWCSELGPGYAVARRSVADDSLRPGGFISGPTQFAAADAALWYLVFAAIGRVEPMALTSELSIRFLRPAQGKILWARAELESAGRRNVVGTVHLWCDDRDDRPTATAQGTYALPLDR
jgi:acyl-coenzyme A thioesterase PaaI-like protein